MGGRARAGRLGARAWWPAGLPGGPGFNMMAAEAGGEEGGPVAAGAAGGGGAAAGAGSYPAAAAACRVKIPAALPVAAAAPYAGLSAEGRAAAGTLDGGAALGPGLLGAGSGAGALAGAGLSGGGAAAAGVAGAAAAAAAAGPGGEMALPKGTTASLSGETFGAGGGFPPLPPPPHLPALGAGLGTVDEGDSLDGPEYEEEEVAIPLTAPPTNQ